MAILERFSDIISANINALIDKMENPAKMIDQYLRDMMEDLAEVKRSTAGVMAEETRTKRLVDENQAEVIKYTDYAKKALEAGNENDARIFLTKKQELENVGAGLATSYASAHENAVKMRQMHDKLATDIETLKSRREMIKSKMAVAKTQETLNKATDSIASTKGAMSSFERMEEKADRMLDKANAMAELNAAENVDVEELASKYEAPTAPEVEDELAALKAKLGK